jgi:hypothetical protein
LLASERVKTSSQWASVLPLLDRVSTTNQRGQPAFSGMVNFASVSFSGTWAGLPAGWFLWPASSLPPSMAASGPVTRSASRERS